MKPLDELMVESKSLLIVGESNMGLIAEINEKFHEIMWVPCYKTYTMKGEQIVFEYDKRHLNSLVSINKKNRILLINQHYEIGETSAKNHGNCIVITEIKGQEDFEYKSFLNNGRIDVENRELSQFLNTENSGESYTFNYEFFSLHLIKENIGNDRVITILNKIVGFKDLNEFIEAAEITEDGWNDYGYWQMLNLSIWGHNFSLRVNPRNQDMIDYIKGKGRKPDVENLCALGDRKYYEFLKKYLPFEPRKELFERINDLAYNMAELDRIESYYATYTDPATGEWGIRPPVRGHHNFFNNSFLRTTSIQEIKEVFHPLALSGISMGEIEEQGNYKIKNSVNDEILCITYQFRENQEYKGQLVLEKKSKTHLPMNVYGIVGGNGSGKSYKINKIIERHIGDDNNFSKIIHFSLSPFDSTLNSILDSVDTNTYERVGFKSDLEDILENLKDKFSVLKEVDKIIIKWGGKIIESENERMLIYETVANTFNPQINNAVKQGFIWYIQDLLLDLIASADKTSLWGECLDFFSFEPWAKKIKAAFQDKALDLDSFMEISKLSSGQATILLYITKLVSSVNRGSLVIFDEPETFMHPPMMKSFIRAVSRVAEQIGAFCLVATHSPVIIQEIPHCNVYKINSNHEITNVHYKTYGQNIDSLYKNIYGIELQHTGYNSLLIERKKIALENFESSNLLYDSDIKYLGDEAYLKYILIKEDIKQRRFRDNEES